LLMLPPLLCHYAYAIFAAAVTLPRRLPAADIDIFATAAAIDAAPLADDYCAIMMRAAQRARDMRKYSAQQRQSMLAAKMRERHARATARARNAARVAVMLTEDD